MNNWVDKDAFFSICNFYTFCGVACCGAVINGFQESLGSPTSGASFWMHCHMWTWMGMGMWTRTQLGNVNDAECWLSGCSFSSDSNFHLSLSSKIQRHTVAVIVDVHRRPKVPAATICIFGPEPRLHLSQSSRNEAPLRPHLPLSSIPISSSSQTSISSTCTTAIDDESITHPLLTIGGGFSLRFSFDLY